MPPAESRKNGAFAFGSLGASAWAHLAAIGFIGCIFASKYLPRLGINVLAAAAAYSACYAFQIFCLGKLAGLAGGSRAPKRLLALLALVWAGAMLPLYLRIDPLALNVDRWSALEYFWKAVEQGEYPYRMHSHLDHNISGFPGLFLLVAPFHFAGDVGLLQFAALAAFAALVWDRFRNAGPAGFLLGLLFALPAFLYEVICRSDLFSNMVAVAWMLHLAAKPGMLRGRRLYAWGGAWGLLLSTRGVVVIPLMLLGACVFRSRGARAAFGFGAVVTAVFLLTFLPFYLWDPGLFREHNPFYVQSGYIPGWLLGLVMLACAGVGLRDGSGERFFTHTAALLFSTLLLCLGLQAAKHGLGKAVAESVFDITYFSLTLPFLLISLGQSLGSAVTPGLRQAAAIPR